MSDTGFPTDGPVDTGATETNVTPDVTPEQSSDNPAWKPLLDALPTSLHGLARPHLQEWDRNVQNLVQKVQSPYQPYKGLIDEGVSFEEIQQARNLMRMIATDPRTFYDRMTDHYRDEWGLGQISDQGQNGDEWEEDPEQDNPLAAQLREANAQIAAMQSNQETIANYLAGQHNSQIQQEANARVETEFNEVKTKYGELSPQQTSVIAAIAIQNEISVPEAADVLFGMQGQQAPPPKPAVRVMPTTGGVPAAPPVNSANLSGVDRRTLVANILAQNAQNNNS